MWTVKTVYGKLKVAVAYAGGPEMRWASFRAPTGDHPLSGGAGSKKDWKGLAKDMEEFQQKIRDLTSAKIFDLKTLLQETLDAWRGDKKGLERVISTCFHEHDWPRVKKLVGDKWPDLTAGKIFGEELPVFMDRGDFKVGIRPVKKILQVGDLGYMTSKGFIQSRRESWSRSREDRIMKAIVENHPEFVENVSVLLELKDPATMEGGDLMALSEDALAIGIRSATNREAAVEVSKALPDKTVYAVLKFPMEVGSGWVGHYGKHLNYIFNMVDEDKALVAPYIFDYPKGSKKTLLAILKTLSDDLYRWEPVRDESDLRPDRWAKLSDKLKPRIEKRVFGALKKDRLEAFSDLGNVEILKKGKVEAKKDSFVKALIEDEVLSPDGIILVGGDPEDIDYRNEFHHWVTAVREGGFACSVAVVKPGTVIAYHHMLKTNEALEDAGVEVNRLDGRYVELLTGTGFGDLLLSLGRK